MRHPVLRAGALGFALLSASLPASRAEAPEAPARSVTIVASPSILKEGLRCLVDLRPEKDERNTTVSMTYEGVIDKATDDGLALTVTTITRREAYDSPLANVPVLNRLTRNIGVARPKPSDKDAKVWVPAEKIGSVKVLE